jgi:two-component system, NtrC family, response regulator HydG
MGLHATVLVVGDDEQAQAVVHGHLQHRFTVLTASDPARAANVLAQAEVDVLLLDVRATDAEGLRAVDDVCRSAGDVPVVFVAGLGPDDENGCAGGAPLLCGRPVRIDDVVRALEDAATEHRLAQERLKRPVPDDPAHAIIAESGAMQRVIGLIDRAALCDTPVLLIGESGTGKELFAHALHTRSPRASGPFVAVNCSAIPETLLENELFGHRQGAFTDARKDQRGLFQAADHGTIFLDEIGDMAPALQGKLLRVLQEREVQPLGASAPVHVDVRVVTATHRDLDERVAAGRFRQDLWYRINVVDIRVPPLRDRLEDLMPLLAHFLEKQCRRLGRPQATVSAEALEQLRRHSWPGNVRELENVIERALVLGRGPAIELDDLPEALKIAPAPGPPATIGRPLAAVEREHILSTLQAVDGNKSAAARALGLNRKTLYRKLIHASRAR